MLLYVDKKKQKRRKIKITSIICASILFIVANIIHFNKALHQTSHHLTEYQSIKKTHPWYSVSDVVYFFSSKKHQSSHVIIIPQTINKENTLAICLALSKIKTSKMHLSFTKDVPEKEYLQQLSTLFLNKKDEETASSVIITTDFNQVASIINKEKLSPSVINYQQATKLKKSEKLQNIINTRFSPRRTPQNQQEKELLAITNFAHAYKKELQNLVRYPEKTADVTIQSFLLKNIGICLISQTETFCNINSDKSLRKNIQSALTHTSAPTQLVLLTSLNEIPLDAPLEINDGLLFRNGTRETFILPQKRHLKPNNINIYAYLKQQAGINPEYHSNEMKFYKFKTTEIDLNDNI